MKNFKINKLVSILLMMLILTGILYGCNKNETENSENQRNESTSNTVETFTMAYLGIESLNPVLSQSNVENSVLYLLQAQLIRIVDGEIKYDAAESYDVSEDCMTYTFHLRDGLKWSDGSNLTAYDFEYGVYCLLSPEMGSPRANGWYVIKNAEKFSNGSIKDWKEVGVKATDNLTITFQLERSVNDFDRSIAFKHIYPVKKDFLDKIGLEMLGSAPDKLLYCGPYVMKIREGSKITLEKNDNYWNASESFPTKYLNFIKVEDANTQIAMFENHEIDAVQNLASQYNEYLKDYLYKVSGSGIELIWINQNGNRKESYDLLSNLNFRKALNYAINRNDVALASNSVNIPANYIIDPGFNGTDGGKFIDEYPVNGVDLNGDIANAKDYLSKAMNELGYKDVSEIPSIDIVSFPGENYKLECETLMNQWKTVLGLDNIHFRQYELGVAIDTFYKMDYDLFVISWEPDVRPTDIMEALNNGGEGNPGVWANDNFETVLKQAIDEKDPVNKAKLTQKAEQIFIDDSGIIPLYVMSTVSAVQNNVTGFQTGSVDGYEFDNLIVTK